MRLTAVVVLLLLAGCPKQKNGNDAGLPDGGTHPDGGGLDAGNDAGAVDGGHDAGTNDAGATDGGGDAGTQCTPITAGLVADDDGGALAASYLPSAKGDWVAIWADWHTQQGCGLRDGGTYSVYVAQLDLLSITTGCRRTLSHAGGGAYFSPDEKYVLYADYTDAGDCDGGTLHSALYSTTVDGTEKHLLTTQANLDWGIPFLNDLAFIPIGLPNASVNAAPLDGGPLVDLGGYVGAIDSYDPDGTRVVRCTSTSNCQGNPGNWSLVDTRTGAETSLLSADSGEVWLPLDNNGAGTAWLPDGSGFVFEHTTNGSPTATVSVMAADGGLTTDLPIPAIVMLSNWLGPRLSPDGTRLAYFSANTDGGLSAIVHDLAAGTDSRVDGLPGLDGGAGVSSLDWSPGSSYLVVAFTPAGSSRPTTLYAGSPATGFLDLSNQYVWYIVTLEPGTNYRHNWAMSPDDKYIAFPVSYSSSATWAVAEVATGTLTANGVGPGDQAAYNTDVAATRLLLFGDPSHVFPLSPTWQLYAEDGTGAATPLTGSGPTGLFPGWVNADNLLIPSTGQLNISDFNGSQHPLVSGFTQFVDRPRPNRAFYFSTSPGLWMVDY